MSGYDEIFAEVNPYGSMVPEMQNFDLKHGFKERASYKGHRQPLPPKDNESQESSIEDGQIREHIDETNIPKSKDIPVQSGGGGGGGGGNGNGNGGHCFVEEMQEYENRGRGTEENNEMKKIEEDESKQTIENESISLDTNAYDNLANIIKFFSHYIKDERGDDNVKEIREIIQDIEQHEKSKKEIENRLHLLSRNLEESRIQMQDNISNEDRERTQKIDFLRRSFEAKEKVIHDEANHKIALIERGFKKTNEAIMNGMEKFERNYNELDGFVKRKKRTFVQQAFTLIGEALLSSLSPPSPSPSLPLPPPQPLSSSQLHEPIPHEEEETHLSTSPVAAPTTEPPPTECSHSTFNKDPQSWASMSISERYARVTQLLEDKKTNDILCTTVNGTQDELKQKIADSFKSNIQELSQIDEETFVTFESGHSSFMMTVNKDGTFVTERLCSTEESESQNDSNINPSPLIKSPMRRPSLPLPMSSPLMGLSPPNQLVHSNQQQQHMQVNDDNIPQQVESINITKPSQKSENKETQNERDTNEHGEQKNIIESSVVDTASSGDKNVKTLRKSQLISMEAAAVNTPPGRFMPYYYALILNTCIYCFDPIYTDRFPHKTKACRCKCYAPQEHYRNVCIESKNRHGYGFFTKDRMATAYMNIDTEGRENALKLFHAFRNEIERIVSLKKNGAERLFELAVLSSIVNGKPPERCVICAISFRVISHKRSHSASGSGFIGDGGGKGRGRGRGRRRGRGRGVTLPNRHDVQIGSSVMDIAVEKPKSPIDSICHNCHNMDMFKSLHKNFRKIYHYTNSNFDCPRKIYRNHQHEIYERMGDIWAAARILKRFIENEGKKYKLREKRSKQKSSNDSIVHSSFPSSSSSSIVDDRSPHGIQATKKGQISHVVEQTNQQQIPDNHHHHHRSKRSRSSSGKKKRKRERENENFIDRESSISSKRTRTEPRHHTQNDSQDTPDQGLRAYAQELENVLSNDGGKSRPHSGEGNVRQSENFSDSDDSESCSSSECSTCSSSDEYDTSDDENSSCPSDEDTQKQQKTVKVCT